MKIEYIVVGLIGLIMSPASFAIDPPAWVGPTNIEAIAVQPNGRIYIELGVPVPDLGCQGNSEGLLEFDTDAPHFNEQYSLLLAAYMAGKQVQIYVNECGYYPYAQNSKVQ